MHPARIFGMDQVHPSIVRNSHDIVVPPGRPAYIKSFGPWFINDEYLVKAKLGNFEHRRKVYRQVSFRRVCLGIAYLLRLNSGMTGLVLTAVSWWYMELRLRLPLFYKKKKSSTKIQFCLKQMVYNIARFWGNRWNATVASKKADCSWLEVPMCHHPRLRMLVLIREFMTDKLYPNM